MAIETQGTVLYAVDPDTEALITVGCVTSIDGIDNTVEQIETTCLEDSARTYISGLSTPGSASFTLNMDTADSSHTRLHEIKKSGATVLWALGWSDGATAATVDTGGTFDLDTGRSWLLFSGFMNSFSFSFQANAVVQSTVGIQISGEPSLIPKV